MGVVLSALGTTAILIGKIVSGYGRFLGYARDLTPAKTGQLKDLHKVKIVETIADTIKPLPITKAMNKTLGVFHSGFKGNGKGGSSIGGGSVVINYNPKVERITQNQERDLQFLHRLAEQYGYIFKIAENNLVFYKTEKLINANSAKTLYGKDITRLTLTEKTSQNYKAVTVSYHNPKTGKKVTATAKNKEGIKGDTLKINARCENKQQALLRAKAALANGNHTIEGSIALVGNPFLVAGLNTKLKGFGHFSGKYHITQARHTIDKSNGYSTSLEVKSC